MHASEMDGKEMKDKHGKVLLKAGDSVMVCIVDGCAQSGCTLSQETVTLCV